MTSDGPDRAGEVLAGPIVWAGIIATTSLLLLLLQGVLWLVIPALLGLILYYLLQPAVRRLVFSGLDHELAASLVAGVFFVAIAAALALVLPWAAAQATNWHMSLSRYLDGGVSLLERTLRLLESESGLLRNAHVAETVTARIDELTSGFVERHLPDVAMAVAAWLPSILLAPLLTYFFLRDGRRFARFLARAMPNAYFERTLKLLHEVNQTTRAYFVGLIQLTLVEGALLALGLVWIGLPGAMGLGFLVAVMAWVPYVGSAAGGLMLLMVAATDFPNTLWPTYAAGALFLAVRLLDDFVLMPLIIGRHLRLHPLVAILMLFAGGVIAGVAGLMLVLPVLGVVMVVGETLGRIVTDPRLRARHRHALRLRRRQAAMNLPRP
ncbi:MAG: hypothetical protein AMXMBFR6_12890 [Betaproteobacteria bacterium]|nr:AI-2E family transporter [Rhodocyclaceae bacterium]MCG3185964.1 putative transport protein [Rhodocyclaceae bacterium]